MEKQEIEATEKAPKAVAKSSSRTVIGATHITSNKRNEATCPPPPPNNVSRTVHLDTLRLIAIFLVLFNHTWTRGFSLWTISRNSGVIYWFYMFLSIADKIGVPLFLMISGALLLQRKESLSYTLQKAFRIVVVLTAFSALQYMYGMRGSLGDMSLYDFLSKLPTEPLTGAYWYLYAYLGFLLMLPLLQHIAQVITQQEMIYLLLLRATFCAVLPVAEWFLWKGGRHTYAGFSVPIVMADTIFYPLLGYYVEHRVNINELERKGVAGWMWAISGGSIAVCCVLTHCRCVVFDIWDETNVQIFYNILIFIPATTVYLHVKKQMAATHISQRTKGLLTAGGGAVFGVFLLENILRESTNFVYELFLPIVGSMAASLIWIFFAICVGLIIVILIRKISIVDWLI